MSEYDELRNSASSNLYNSSAIESARSALKNLYKEREKSVYDDVIYKIYSNDYYSSHEILGREDFIRYDEKERQQLYDHIAPKYKAMADVGMPYTQEKLGQSAVWLADVLDLDFTEARRVAPLLYPEYSDRDMKEKSYLGRMGDQVASAFYGDMLGYMASLAILTDSEDAKKKADYFYEKQMQHRNWQDFGWAGNLVLENLQGVYSMASMALPALLTAGVGGAIGASAQAVSAFSKGVMIATSGATQAGQNYYMMSKMKDEYGNALFDMDNPSWGERAVFLGALVTMGAIETAEWELLSKIPTKLRKDISSRLAQKTVQDATIKTMKVFTGEGAKGFAKQTLKNIVGEGAEEFLQQMVGNLAECYEANLRNAEGAEFSEADITHIKDGVWDAFKGGVKGSIVASLLGGAYTTRWNNRYAEQQENQNKRVQNTRSAGDLIPLDVVSTKEYSVTEEEVNLIKERYAKDDGYNLPIVNVEANGVTTVKPQTHADAVVLEAVKSIEGETGAVKVSLNHSKVLSLSTTEEKVDFASRLGGEVAKGDNQVLLFQNEWDVRQAVDILGDEFLLKAERQDDGSYKVSVDTPEGIQEYSLIDNSDKGLKAVELSGDMQGSSVSLKSIKLTKTEGGELNDYINDNFSIDDNIEKPTIKDGRYTLTEREADGLKGMIATIYKSFKKADTTVKLTDILQALSFNVVSRDEVQGTDARGFTRFAREGEGGKFTKATINLSDTATLDTIVHETGHFILVNANEGMLQGFKTAYGIDITDKASWQNEVSDRLKQARGITAKNYTYEELFANDFVRYLRDGVAPNNKIKSLFEAMKSVLRYVREYLQDHLNKETREAFNTLFADEKNGSRKEKLEESRTARITSLLEKDRKRLEEANKRLAGDLTEPERTQYNKLKDVLAANIENYERMLKNERVVSETSEYDNDDIRFETSERSVEDLTEEEAIDLVAQMRANGYLIPRRVAEIAGDVEESLKYAQLDNYRLLGEDFEGKAKKIIDSVDLVERNDERNIYDIALEKWFSEYTDESGNVNIAGDTKALIELSLKLELLESTRDKNQAFVAEFGTTKEGLIKLSKTLKERTYINDDGVVATRVFNFDINKRLLNINDDTTWREIRQIRKEVQDNATQYREIYESATGKATDEVVYYNEWADEIKGERANTDLEGVEYQLDNEALKETEKSNRIALNSIVTDLKKLGASNKSKEEVQAQLKSISDEIKDINKDIKQASDERKRLAKEEQKEKLEKQKKKYELALEKIKEKERRGKIARAMRRELTRTRQLLQYNEKNMDADYAFGLLMVKEQVYDYGRSEGAFIRDLDIRKAIAKRLGVSSDMMPPVLAMLIDEAGINLNGIRTLRDMKSLNAVLSEYSKMGRASLREKETARRKALFDKKLAVFNQMQSEENRLAIDFETKDSVKILNSAIADLPKRKQTKFTEGLNSLFNRTLHAPQIAHRLDGEYNGLFSQFVESEKVGERKRIAGVIERTNSVMSKIKALGIKERAFPYWLLDKKNEAGAEYTVLQTTNEGEVPLALNRSQAVGVYIYNKNETSRAKLLSRAGNKITEESLNHLIDEVLTEQDKAFGDILIEEISSRWDAMSDVFYNLYNGVLGIEENYFPLRGENAPLSVSQGEAYVPNENNLNLGGGRNIISYVDKGMTYDRNESAIYPIDLNVWGTFKSQIVAQERFINQAEWIKNAQYLVSDRGVGLAVQKQYGKSYQQELKSWVNDIANPRRVISDADTIFSRVVSNVAVSKMMFSLTTALKQIGALGAVFADENFSAGSFFKASHMMLFNHKEVDSLLREHAPQILEQKGKSLSVEFARVLEANAKSKAGQALKDFQKYGLALMEGLDLSIRELVWVSTYEANLKSTGDQQIAVQKANALVDSTQNNSAVSDLSSLQREPSPFARAMLVFSNQSFQYWNKIVDSKYLFKNKKYKELVGTWGMVLFNTALMVALSGLFFKKTYDENDKKKKWQEIGLKSLNDTIGIIPLAGGFTDALDGYNSGNGSFGMEILTDLGRLTYNSITLDGEDKWEKLLKNAEAVLGDVGELTISLPTTQIKRAMKFQITDEDESRKDAVIRGLVNILLGGEFYRNIKED